MAEPVTKKKQGVFEDFPLPERKHFDHRAARGSLGAGFAPLEEEKQAFAHIKRTTLGDSHGSSTIASSDKGTWRNSYQAMADGTDDIGQVRKLSRKKKSFSHVNSAKSELSMLHSGSGPAGRSFMYGSGRENLENHKHLHMPGYTGHVPKATQVGRQADSRNPADKSLLAENYRHNLAGYTGHVK